MDLFGTVLYKVNRGARAFKCACFHHAVLSTNLCMYRLSYLFAYCGVFAISIFLLSTCCFDDKKLPFISNGWTAQCLIVFTVGHRW